MVPCSTLQTWNSRYCDHQPLPTPYCLEGLNQDALPPSRPLLTDVDWRVRVARLLLERLKLLANQQRLQQAQK